MPRQTRFVCVHVLCMFQGCHLTSQFQSNPPCEIESVLPTSLITINYKPYSFYKRQIIIYTIQPQVSEKTPPHPVH
ncbi:hypothetical protein QBC42DRAFT_60749 [Cladorrhinum samala]|uniref:Secreted protein n=1 Tax=Cladorrhinum samala TaxID=585594 RepID=A0AAV9HSI6_9PEZI|nr:hypothetical protein QBC42DRAFT_60749 [Cladorrhinum samala]